MTHDQLTALAARLLNHAAMHDSVVPNDDELRQWRDDLIAAAKYLRQCAEAEPVATVRVHDTGGNAGIAWSGVPTEHAGTMRGGTPLYTHPQPPSAQADALKVLRDVAVMLPSDSPDYADTDRIPAGFVYLTFGDLRRIRAVLAAQGGKE